MRTVANPTRWLGSIVAFVTALAPIAIASAQEVPPPTEAPAAEVPAEAAPGAEPERSSEDEAAIAETEPERSPEDEAAIAVAEQAEIDAALAEDAPHCSGTGVEGVVRDAETRETLIEAPVIVVGRGTRVMSDYDGRFAIDLPPGTYSLRSYYDLYQPTRIDDVVVRRGQCTSIDLELATESSTGEEVVIEVRAEAGTAASQLRARREAPAVEDAVSSEEIRRSPDSTASEAARRIVGVTIRDDYLYVRGLGGRYVTALMNGVALPQTDPDVPGVQLDILPSTLLESLTVRKTFTADSPGDWAGGLVDVGTQSFPTSFQLRVGVSFGVNTGTSFQSTLGYRGGGLDWLALDDGTRELPSAVRDVHVSEVSNEERDALSLQFPNTWAIRGRTALPNLGLSLSVGDTVDLGGHLLGYRLLASYRIGERPIPDFVQSLRVGDEGVAVRETLSQRGMESYAQLGALGTLTFEIDRGHELTLNALFSQNSEDFVGRATGMNEAAGALQDSYRLAWIQRTLLFGQLLGVHRNVFGSARLDWQLNGSLGERRQPDMRDISYLADPEGRYRYTAGPASGSRFYSDLDDASYGAGAGLTIPISQLTFGTGGLFRRSERGLAIRRFTWLTRPRAPGDGVYLPPSQLFSQDNIHTYLRLQDQTRQEDSYDASQELLAAYASAEWRPWDFLRFYGGIRAESFRQLVSSSQPVGMQMEQAMGTIRTDVDPLPSAGAVVEIIDGFFFRASYGGTVGRPQIRELAPFAFIDVLRRRTVTGQPGLERTYIHNFDLRAEWFPSETEVLAISVFGKLFESPIEQVIVSAEGDASFANVQGAENFGAEVEARFHFGHFAPGLEWITFGANLALIYSRATLTPEQRAASTNAERPLAGQAPWVINAGLGLAPPGTGLQLNVFYNVLGERLEDVGRQGVPDVYRMPFHQLDVTASWEFAPGFSLRLSGQNLLFQRQELRQGDHVVLGINPGTQVALGFGASN